MRTLLRFKKQFMFDGKMVDVHFHPVNCIEKQLYQIYIPVNGQSFRIHMQKSEGGSFKIALKDQVPQNIKELESVFEEAIINS